MDQAIGIFSVLNQVLNLCKDAAQYPHNFAGSHDSLEYSLFSYQAQLTTHQRRLFSPETEASLNFYELDDGGTGKSNQWEASSFYVLTDSD